MKIAIVAGIHGNNPALAAVMECIEREAVDQIIVAGDIIGGPEPNRLYV